MSHIQEERLLSCSQLDTVSLSPIFHSCFLKGTSFLCRCHPSCVVWTLTQVAQLISSGQVMWRSEILFWGGCWIHSLEGSTHCYLVLKRLNYSENEDYIPFVYYMYLWNDFWHFCMNEVPANKFWLCFCLMGCFEFYLIFRTVYRTLYLFALNQ